jgi:DNA-binding transcriptional LysR family regulator
MLHGERVVVLSDPLYLTGPFSISPAESAAMVIMRMPGLDSLKRAVEMELGLGVIPIGTAGAVGSHSTLVARPMRGVEDVPAVTLVYRESDPESPSTAAFLAMVRNAKRPVTSNGEQCDGRRTAAHI